MSNNHNLPPGSEDDNKAPYNEENLEIVEWEALQNEDCGSCGMEAVWCNGQGICEECYPDNPEYEEQDDVIFDKGYEE